MRSIPVFLVALAFLLTPWLALAGPPAGGTRKGVIETKHKRSATLTITAEPRAGVSIDGGFRGHTPLSLDVSPGSKTVVLESPSGQREVRNIRVDQGESLSIHHDFPVAASQDAPGPSGGGASPAGSKTPYLKALKRQGLGVINVSTPIPGRLIVDGNDTLKTTPVTDHEATAGSHRIKVMFATGGESEVDVDVVAGQRSQVTLRP